MLQTLLKWAGRALAAPVVLWLTVLTVVGVAVMILGPLDGLARFAWGLCRFVGFWQSKLIFGTTAEQDGFAFFDAFALALYLLWRFNKEGK